VTAHVPPGWPQGVPPAGAPGWERRATGWLLDLCPPEYRGYPVVVRHPVLLVRLAARQVAAQAQGTDAALATVRADLADVLLGPVVAEAVQVLEAERERLVGVLRAVELVEFALRGGTFVPRL
jgi:hypothetical protein